MSEEKTHTSRMRAQLTAKLIKRSTSSESGIGRESDPGKDGSSAKTGPNQEPRNQCDPQAHAAEFGKSTSGSISSLVDYSDSDENDPEVSCSKKSRACFRRIVKPLTSRCQQLFGPFIATFSGSSLPSITWAFILIVTFLMLIWTSEVEKGEGRETRLKPLGLTKGHLQICLITLMLLSLTGILYCFKRRKDTSFLIVTEHSENTNSYLLGGVYLFGAGTLFMIIQQLQTYPHMIVKYPEINVKSVKQPLHLGIFAQYNITNSTHVWNLTRPTVLTIKQHLVLSYVSWVEIFYSTVRLIFTSIQILFLQAFWKSTFRKLRIIKFLFFHIIATNICIWILYVAEETHIFEHLAGHWLNLLPGNSTMDAAVEITHTFSEYLVPFTLEYSLIAAGILYGMASEMKHFTSGVTGANILARSMQWKERNRGYKRVDNSEHDTDQVDGLAMSFRSFSKRTSQNKTSAQPGLLIGLLFSIVLLTSALSLKDENLLHMENCLTFFFVFQSLLFICHIVSLWRILGGLQSHKRKSHAMRPDDCLLIIGLLGGVGFDIPLIIAASRFIINFQPGKGGLHREGTMKILLTSELLTFIARVLQTWVIIVSQRYKCLKSNKDQISSSKVIRQQSLFVLVTNLGLWALDSFFELKDFAQTSYPCGKVSYGEDWKTIVSFTFPFCIFFRFHSAAMIFDLWAKFKFTQCSKIEGKSKDEVDSLV